jgi:hypothetical protein
VLGSGLDARTGPASTVESSGEDLERIVDDRMVMRNGCAAHSCARVTAALPGISHACR